MMNMERNMYYELRRKIKKGVRNAVKFLPASIEVEKEGYRYIMTYKPYEEFEIKVRNLDNKSCGWYEFWSTGLMVDKISNKRYWQDCEKWREIYNLLYNNIHEFNNVLIHKKEDKSICKKNKERINMI